MVNSADSARRFAFGRNWRRFLTVLDGDRLALAEASLRTMLGAETLAGRRFLDVGSGSGLFSLAARRLGASVHSFDYDADAVRCAQDLKQRFFPGDPGWTIQRGSILDADFVATLGRHDIVYAWGVLHHTGGLWRALANVETLVAPGGTLWIAVYNDQGWISKAWTLVKRTYVSSALGRALVLGTFIPAFAVKDAVGDAVRLRSPLASHREYRTTHRGMSKAIDWLDWLGGYPFEVATAGQVFAFFRERGFTLERLDSARFEGNNQYLFVRRA